MAEHTDYIDYQSYVSLGGQLAEGDFDAALPWAESWLDALTLGRLRAGVPEAWSREVSLAMVALVDATPTARAEQAGQVVTSFSNGQNSFSFAASAAEAGMSPTLASVAAYVLRLLPVELVSACAAYNGAVG